MKRKLLFFMLLACALNIRPQIHAETLIYTIKQDDTLKSIAEHFDISTTSLVKINRFRNEEEAQRRIVQGESILVPLPEIVLASVSSHGIENDTVDLLPGKVDEPIVLAQAPKAPTLRPAEPIKQKTEQTAEPKAEDAAETNSRLQDYTVQSGDNISSLAVRFDSSSDAIREANALSSDRIRIGQKLKIPSSLDIASIASKTSKASKPSTQTAPEIQLAQQRAVQQKDDPSAAIELHATTRLDSPSSANADDKEQIYIVQEGDTLLGISRKTKTSIGVIRALNQLEDDYIRPEQALRISSYERAVATIASDQQGSIENRSSDVSSPKYTVQDGDTLSSISRKFGVSISQLKRWNQLNDLDFLKIGQSLQTSAPSKVGYYTVAEGDTLWSISQRLGTSVAQLEDWNPGLNSVLRPEQTLALGSGSAVNAALQKRSQNQDEQADQTDQEGQNDDAAGEETIYPPNSFPQEAPKAAPKAVSQKQLSQKKSQPVKLRSYFTRHAPRVKRQPSATYYEEFTDDPLANYQTARKLLAQFEKKVAAMPALGNSLKGYHILIDPGHGGLDPGFNSQSEDGNGNPLYIIEDEYNYDYALRLYRLLRRNGADVGLTIISPNQLIVDSPDASLTLVSQKNEVYNSPFINQRGEYSSWPVGTPVGLHKRVEVAESFFNGAPKDKRIFISLHNDNSPWDKDGRLVLFYNDSLTIDHLGEQFAKHMMPFLGKNAHVRGQNLAVLRRNPAKYAVLVELRNIAYSRNSWAIRNANLRQEDVEMLGNGILSFVESL